MAKTWFGFFILGLLSTGSFLSAEEIPRKVIIQRNSSVDPVTDIVDKLKLQKSLLEKIRPHVERPEMDRFLVLRSTTHRALAKFESQNFNPVHKEVIRALEDMYIAFAFSDSYFQRIDSDVALEDLQSVLAIAEWIASERGYADEYKRKMFFSTNTFSTFSHMYRLVRQLETMPLPTDLQNKLVELKPLLGKTLAIAQNDWYPAFEAAKKPCTYIRELYPDFDRISLSDAAYEVIMEIKGLNELFIQASGIFSRLGNQP